MHTCHATGCLAECKPELLMCGAHWRKVPRAIQQAVWANYRPGQCNDKRPSMAWLRAADAAIGYVARMERKPITANQDIALEVYDQGQISGPSAVGFDDLLSRRGKVRRRVAGKKDLDRED